MQPPYAPELLSESCSLEVALASFLGQERKELSLRYWKDTFLHQA